MHKLVIKKQVATFSEIKGLRFGEFTFYSLLYWHTILSLQ